MRLDKYYFDGISADGDIFICYSAVLQIGYLKIPYSSVIYHHENKTLEKQSFRKDQLVRSENQLHWESTGIKASGSWELGNNQISAELYSDDQNNSITWQVLAGATEANLEIFDRSYSLTGYAEKLEVDMPLLKLPIKRLLWGRWISDISNRSIVWVIWEDTNGNTAVSRLWENTTEYPVTDYSLEQIVFENGELNITKVSDIRAGNVDDTVKIKKIFKAFLPSSFKNIMERKYYGIGDIAGETGKVIYEEVCWQ